VPVPILMTHKKVMQIVDALTASDPDWTYKPVAVEKDGEFLWSIEVYDEEGLYISTFHKSKTDE
jgi:hypothetical protein